MINPKNSLILATTKLKTRKIRLSVSILTSSLMFGVILFGVIIYQGSITDTLHKFSQTGLNSRSIIEAKKGADDLGSYREVKKGSSDYKKIEQILDKKVAEAEAISKQLNISFDKSNYKNQINPFIQNTGEEKSDFLHFNSDNSNIVIKEFLKQTGQANKASDKQYLDILKRSADQSSGKIHYGYRLDSSQSQIIELDHKTGEYKYNHKAEPESEPAENPTPVERLRQNIKSLSLNEISVLPESLNQPFMIKHQWKVENKTIPVMLPLNSVEKLLDIKPLQKANTDKQSLIKRNKSLIDQAVGLKFKQCYYNQTATEQLEKALAYQTAAKEDAKHKGETNYQKRTDEFEIVYQVPDKNSCALPKVIKDKRTTAEKQLESKQAEFERRTSGKIKPPAKASEVDFEIVGILPISHSQNGPNDNIVDLILDTIISGPDLQAIIPEQLFDKMPDKSQVIKNLNASSTEGSTAQSYKTDSFYQTIDGQSVQRHLFIELPDGEAASKFVDKHVCLSLNIFDDEPRQDCPLEKQFTFSSFANNQMQLYQFGRVAWKAARNIGIFFGGIAALIMFGVISRMLSDNRKETAVFRAIGFKRLDIGAIYVSYTLIVCLLIIAVATALAMIAALLINNAYQQQYTVQALYVFNSNNFDLQASFIGWNWQYIGMIYGLVVLSGLVSLIFPLLTSISRNPINDMRSE